MERPELWMGFGNRDGLWLSEQQAAGMGFENSIQLGGGEAVRPQRCRAAHRTAGSTRSSSYGRYGPRGSVARPAAARHEGAPGGRPVRDRRRCRLCCRTTCRACLGWRRPAHPQRRRRLSCAAAGLVIVQGQRSAGGWRADLRCELAHAVVAHGGRRLAYALLRSALVVRPPQRAPRAAADTAATAPPCGCEL